MQNQVVICNYFLSFSDFGDSFCWQFSKWDKIPQIGKHPGLLGFKGDRSKCLNHPP